MLHTTFHCARDAGHATRYDTIRRMMSVTVKLNDRDVHIRGFSHHSDFGAVGGAVPDRINVFRANALRSVGGNWWRTSHNPYCLPTSRYLQRPTYS